MPIYMDVHIVPGVTAKAVSHAHSLDMAIQAEHACKCMTYWVDESRESVFCLIEAPSKEAVVEMHNKAHGLIPHKIIEVSSKLVESFLGRIFDPEEATTTEDGLKVFSDPSFRILVITKINDPVLLKHKLGKEKAGALLQTHNAIVRKHLLQFGGREVEHEGSGFILSFSSAGKAVSCALALQKDISDADTNLLGLKISISSGEPVGKSKNLFGDTIQKAHYMCAIAKYFQVAMASSVRDLVAKDHFEDKQQAFFSLSPKDEALLELLYNKLEENWQNAEFDLDNYCQEVAMSKSQLYRKTIALTGLSPNILLKEFRLEKAKELMKKQHYNIAQITFETGFTSPSYFTKCFKKKFGILPMAYLELLQ
jgi:AraC-like DNA-binding protein